MTDDLPGGVEALNGHNLGRHSRFTWSIEGSGEPAREIAGTLVGVRHRLDANGKIATVAEVDVGPVVVEYPFTADKFPSNRLGGTISFGDT